MKKTVMFILIFTMLLGLCSGISVQAASGDIVGSIYATDIKTCINGIWVDSYNIGGRTVVIVEDIVTQYVYNDSLRTLIFNNLAPDFLVAGEHSYDQEPGTPVGKIYETDIKTIFRGKELTSYSLNGKMAVVVEELGDDKEFSEIGGRYFWDAQARTLSLESMYRYPYTMRSMLEDSHFNIVLTETEDGLDAQPVPAPLAGGQILCEKEVPDDTIIPVFYNGEIIGYRCSFPLMRMVEDEDKVVSLFREQTPVDHFYPDKVTEMILENDPVQITYQDWLSYFENYTLMTVNEQFETDDYIFLNAFFAHSHGGTQALIKLNKKDGTRIDYDDHFPSVSFYGQKRFENVVIDREQETVSLHYDYDYVIDLKTDEIRAFNNLITDIGVGTAQGQPSEYDATSARNGQAEYILTSGDSALTVKGFGAPEYYYANMLPLKETFDFLNIKYSFENNVLTIDTGEARPFTLEITENKVDILGDAPISYLQVDKVLANGEETQITYPYISGHFEATHTGRAKAMPYVCNGIVYINHSYVASLYENE